MNHPEFSNRKFGIFFFINLSDTTVGKTLLDLTFLLDLYKIEFPKSG